MSPRQGFPDPEQLRGEKILREMERLERRKKTPKTLSCMPWVLLIALVLAIVAVVGVNWGRLSGYWQRLVMPDSIPDLGR